jgi:hypothetical protein
MAGYAKVFDSLLTSSLWVKDHYVLRIWIAMLARCDSRGVVEGSVPGFASLCRVTDGEMQAALDILTSPDPHSRTPDNEGRRLEVVPGGWRILNYGAYRAKGQEKEGSKAPFMRALRDRRREEVEPPKHGNALLNGVTGDPTATAGTEVLPSGVSSAPVAPPALCPPKADPMAPLREELLAHWRAVAVPAGLPDVLKGTVLKLRRIMDTRLKDPEWLGLFREAVDYAARHPDGAWMRGGGERPWRVTLDWLLKPSKAEETAAKARAARGRASPGRTSPAGAPPPSSAFRTLPLAGAA